MRAKKALNDAAGKIFLKWQLRNCLENGAAGEILNTSKFF
jgi:hypothetical protein